MPNPLVGRDPNDDSSLQHTHRDRPKAVNQRGEIARRFALALPFRVKTHTLSSFAKQPKIRNLNFIKTSHCCSVLTGETVRSHLQSTNGVREASNRNQRSRANRCWIQYYLKPTLSLTKPDRPVPLTEPNLSGT